MKFLIDTGALVSLIKSTSIKNPTTINNVPIVLNGVSPNAPISTCGETEIELEIHSKAIMTRFQVLNTLTNIPFNGLLGDDFLRSQKARIDYSTSTISLSSIPFQILLLRNTPQRYISTIRINPRTETIVPVKLLNPHMIKEGIIWSQQLNSNNTLLIPNAIVKVHENKALLTIINSSSTVQNISIPELYIETSPARIAHI